MNTSDFIIKYKENPKGAMTSMRYDTDLQENVFKHTGLDNEEYSLNEAIYTLLNPKEHTLCTWCNEHKRKFHKISKGYASTCTSKECISKWRSDLNSKSSKQIDWDASLTRRENTCEDKYGAKSNLSSGTKSRQFATDRLIELYGVDSPLKNEKLAQQRKTTCVERHGTTNFIRSDKAIQTMQDKYGYTNPMQSPEIRANIAEATKKKKLDVLIDKCKDHNVEILNVKNNYIKLKCNTCTTVTTKVLRNTLNMLLRAKQSPCRTCNPINRFRSKGENEVYEFIKTIYDGEVQANRKYLGSEIDVIIPDHKLCIEYNGVYWHSELRKDKPYHKLKKASIEALDYDLIQIWEDHWNDLAKQKIIKSKLMHKLGMSEVRVGARKCEISIIDSKEAKAFMDENHLYGSIRSKIKIGLKYNDELIMLCTFGKPRTAISGNSTAEYELLRMSTKMGYSISGGFSKIISHFKKNYTGEILTYSDCDWTNTKSNGYTKAGFEYVKWTTPGYHWVVSGMRHNRMSFMRHKIEDIELTETVDDYMYTRNNYKVWNSGNLLFKLL